MIDWERAEDYVEFILHEYLQEEGHLSRKILRAFGEKIEHPERELYKLDGVVYQVCDDCLIADKLAIREESGELWLQAEREIT